MIDRTIKNQSNFAPDGPGGVRARNHQHGLCHRFVIYKLPVHKFRTHEECMTPRVMNLEVMDLEVITSDV